MGSSDSNSVDHHLRPTRGIKNIRNKYEMLVAAKLLRGGRTVSDGIQFTGKIYRVSEEHRWGRSCPLWPDHI